MNKVVVNFLLLFFVNNSEQTMPLGSDKKTLILEIKIFPAYFGYFKKKFILFNFS